MSKKILNLQLIYKGKTLDNAIQGRDFTSKFYIGKNKNLLWQLLDISFPDKFKFVEKKGSNYNINLSNNMDVKVHKDGEILDKNKLQKILTAGYDYFTKKLKLEKPKYSKVSLIASINS